MPTRSRVLQLPSAAATIDAKGLPTPDVTILGLLPGVSKFIYSWDPPPPPPFEAQALAYRALAVRYVCKNQL